MENGFITPDTIYFNNTVLDKASFLAKWMIPVKDSWLAKKITKQLVTGSSAWIITVRLLFQQLFQHLW